MQDGGKLGTSRHVWNKMDASSLLKKSRWNIKDKMQI